MKNRLRLRFDAANDNPFADRAEFFYPKCGCFSATPANPNPGPGPRKPESSVDYQELEADLEVALADKFSVFAEVPIRFINPEQNANSAGLSDVRAGFKYGLINDCDRWLTFQFRGYFPSGDGDRGLGTEHVSLEPGLLFQSDHDRLTTFGEFKGWIPLGNETAVLNDVSKQFSGTVLRYGAGAGYDIYRQFCVSEDQQSCCCHDVCDCQVGGYRPQVITNRLTALVEVVGWSVLDGLKDNTAIFTSAAGDSIVNLKVGLRWSTPQDSIYVSYGHALTSEVWYNEIVRVGYDYRF